MSRLLVLRAAESLVLAGSGIWAALCLWFRMSGGAAATAAGLWGLAAAAALFALWTGRPLAAAAYGIAFAVLLAWFLSIRPAGEARRWAVDVSRPVTAEIGPDRVAVHNVRDFDWRTPDDFTARWETRSYALAGLGSVDLINSYWMGPAIAHTLISFGFADGRFLAFSVEIRRRPGEDFSNIAGFFKHYELIVVAADERDIVRLRTNVRGENVELFRLDVTADQARTAFVALLERANAVAARPAFYNTLSANCTTVLFGVARVVDRSLPFDWRIIVSGYLPDYAYGRGLLDRGLSLDELRRLGSIGGRARAADRSPDFSSLIREGVPLPPMAAASPARTPPARTPPG